MRSATKDGRRLLPSRKPDTEGSTISIEPDQRQQARNAHWADHYLEVMENANDGIYMLDADGRIVAPNRAMTEIHGYSVDEMDGMPVLDLHLPEDLPRVSCALARVERGERVLEEF